MLTLWGRTDSFNVQKVRWLLEELALPHETVPAGGAFGRLDEPAFRALNPHGKVPVLVDGATAVWESHAILRYLAARYGGPAFWPADPAARAAADGWMDWAQTALQPAFLDGVFWGHYRTPPADRDTAAVARALARTAELFARLDRALADRPFLLGEHLTLADIPAGTALFRWFSIDIPRPDHRHVRRWYDRLQQRPAYREAVMVPFDHMEGQLPA